MASSSLRGSTSYSAPLASSATIATASSATALDQDLYTYTLRVAYLSHLIAASSAPTALPLSASVSATAGGAAGVGGRALAKTSTNSGGFKPAEGWSTLFTSLTDKAGAGGAAGVKYPKELLRVLEAKVERILSPRAPRTLEASALELELRTQGDERLLTALKAFSRTCLALGSETFRRLKENRKLEELILEFVKVASSVARSGTAAAGGDEWKSILNKLVGDFVALVRESVASKEVGKVSPELLARLGSYCDTLAPAPARVQSGISTGEESVAREEAPPGGDMELVQAVGSLFGKSQAELSRDILGLKRLCTERVRFSAFATVYRGPFADETCWTGGVQGSQSMHQQSGPGCQVSCFAR